MIRPLKKYKVQILLSLVVLLALWPLSTFTFIPKWDNIDCYLPYRNFVSYAVRQGELPLWNPFQSMGYPAYSDMQNGMYNPIIWILMLFGEYTPTSLIIELLFYYVIAITGAYKFAGLFVQTNSAKILIALAYGLSGFMLGTSQIMIFIAGAAFLPHILYHFMQLLESKKLLQVLYTVLFLALCITSASPAYTIVLIYIMSAILVFHWIKNLRKPILKKQAFPWWKLSLLFLILICVLLPYIQSVYEFLPYFNRSQKLEYSGFLLENPFDYQEYISFVFPYATLADSEWFGNTDMTMRSGYIGLIPIIFLLYCFKFWRDPKIKWLWLGVLIFLILSAGGTTPLYRFFYELPGFGLFRHPSLFRAHLLLFAAVLAGISFERWNSVGNKKEISRLLIGLISIFLLVLILVIIKPYWSDINLYLTTWDFNAHPVTLFMKGYLFINAVLMLPLLFFALWKVKKGNNVKYYLIGILVMDLLVYSQITSYHTIHYPIKHKDYAAYFKELPDSIDQNSTEKPYKELIENYEPKIAGLWRNTATYHKVLSFEGHNQTQFIHFNTIERNGGLEMTKENPLFYDVNKKIILSEKDSLQANVLWHLDSDFPVKINPDTLRIKDPVIKLNSFQVYVSNRSEKEDHLILNQNYHHLWEAFINGKEVPVIRANEALMAIVIPAKTSGKVIYKFSSPNLSSSILVSIFSYLLLISGILFLSAKNLNKKEN